MWFKILKNIQISGQKTSSRDYVKPDKDGGECRKWWEDLENLFNNLGVELHPANSGHRFEFDFIEEKSEEELCKMREDVTRGFTEVWDTGDSLYTVNLYNSIPQKCSMVIDTDTYGYDYKCIFSVNISLDSYFRDGIAYPQEELFYGAIFWKEMNLFPSDYLDEIKAIDKHLNSGGQLLKLMSRSHEKALEEGKKDVV